MTDYKDKIRAAAERFNPLRPSDPMVRAAMAGAVIWPEEDMAKVQARVDQEYRKLMHKVKTSAAWS